MEKNNVYFDEDTFQIVGKVELPERGIITKIFNNTIYGTSVFNPNKVTSNESNRKSQPAKEKEGIDINDLIE